MDAASGELLVVEGEDGHIVVEVEPSCGEGDQLQAGLDTLLGGDVVGWAHGTADLPNRPEWEQ